MKKILIIAGLIIGLGSFAYAGPSIKVFTAETVLGETSVAIERATSTGFNVNGVTEIGYDFLVTQGTSTPHISIGYQTSMNNSSWTATTIATDDTSAVIYTATDTAFTIPPTEWIRWILKTELLNAVDTTVDLLFKTKNEGGK